jgi:hypothetical protein
MVVVPSEKLVIVGKILSMFFSSPSCIFPLIVYAIFGKYGAVFQIRLGEKDKDTRGTAFVVYEVRALRLH